MRLLPLVAGAVLAALAGCAGPSPDLGPADATVLTRDLVYDPAVLTVAAGAVVEWRNEDDVQHTVTPGDAEQWGTEGSGSDFEDWLAQGGTWAFRFDEPGTYDYYCIPHGSRLDDGTLTGQTGRVVVAAAG